MKILTLQGHNGASEFDVFLRAVSSKLGAAICKKFQAYVELNDVYTSSSLKILNPRIWGYKGTIFKLRVDCGKESARVLFAKTPDNDIVLLHGFIKKTRKTPSKEAKISMINLERLKNGAEVSELLLPR
jgi:phage-related protein